MHLADRLGITLLSEDAYRHLHKLGEFDLMISSWIQPPADICKPGGALFFDPRLGHVYTYHNSAEFFNIPRGL